MHYNERIEALKKSKALLAEIEERLQEKIRTGQLFDELDHYGPEGLTLRITALTSQISDLDEKINSKLNQYEKGPAQSTRSILARGRRFI